MTLDHPSLEATASAPLLIVRFLPCCSLLRVRVWMDDCILAEKLLHQTNNNFNSTQTMSSPVQATQPSSTQNSFAKSKLSSSPLSLLLFPGQTPLFSLPPQSKDGRWWLGCQRPHTGWLGLKQCCGYNGLLLLSHLRCCPWCWFLCFTVGQTPLEGEEIYYFTNTVVHNI